MTLIATMAPAPTVEGPAAARVLPPREVPRYSVAEIDAMAEKFARSGLFGLTQPQAFTLMCLAMARGLDAMEALAQFDIVDGKPAMKAVAMQAHFQAGGGRMLILERSRECCRMECWHPGLHPQHVTFEVLLKDLVDSKVAQRYDRDARKWVIKETYLRFPDDMLHKRCIAKAVRAIAPGFVVGIYTPEEIRDFFDEGRGRPEDRGTVPVPAPAPQAPRKTPWRRPQPAPGRAPAPEAEAEAPDDADAEWRDFIRREVRSAADDLANELKLAGLEPSGAVFLTGHQVVNHLCSTWIDEGTMDASDIAGPAGKRDRHRAAEAVATAYGHAPEEVRADIRDYVRHKLEEARAAAGLPRDGDRDEAQATADEGAPEEPSP